MNCGTYGTICSPPLTTIAPDLREAARMLLQAALDNTDLNESAPVKLVKRSSVRSA